MNNFQKRLQQLQKNLKLDQAILLASPSNNAYFSAFKQLDQHAREGFTLVSKNRSYLLHNSFSPTAHFSFLKKYPAIDHINLKKILQKIVQDQQLTEILLEEESITVAEYKVLLEIEGVELAKFDSKLSWQMKMTKDKHELAEMKKAGQITAQAMAKISQHFRVGVTEKKMACILENHMRKLGADERAFPTIVAFGPNGALPHHQPSETKLKKNSAVLIDMGAKVNGYCSDMTRTFWFGKDDVDRGQATNSGQAANGDLAASDKSAAGSELAAEFKKIETIVKNAYQAVFNYLQKKASKATQPVAQNNKKNQIKNMASELKTKSGLKNADSPPAITAKLLDQQARSVIEQAGYKDFFIHTTGHGLGLDIHEPPSLNWKNEQEIKAGMVFTIEPGIYLKGKFGYRHENTVVVNKAGVEILTKS